jgi:hypothetical protein
LDFEDERNDMTLTIRDSLNGNKLYEIVRLNGEAEVFDYVTNSRRKIETSELCKWFIGLDLWGEQSCVSI